MKIAVFYHAILDQGTVPINTDHAVSIMAEQMHALKSSGLADAANEITIGLHGSDSAEKSARFLAPEKAVIVRLPSGTHSEIPTLELLRRWLPEHPGWYVLYHHIKGVSHPGHALFETWRRRMEHFVVWEWRRCVSDLDLGSESVGAHWLTPERFNLPGKVPFWGGTFWWATAGFLMTLPPLPRPTWENRYEAENWIGRGPRRPIVRDYCPGWPA